MKGVWPRGCSLGPEPERQFPPYWSQPACALSFVNAQDVITWLEGILESSKQRAGYHTEVVEDRAPAGDPDAIKLPTFVAYRWG